MTKKKYTMVFCACVIAIFATRPVVAESLVISALNRGGAITEIGTIVLTEAYQRLGVSMELEFSSGGQGLQLANEGRVDGDLFRAAGLEKDYPNLTQIQVPIASTNYVVFSKNPRLGVRTWDDLMPYSLAYARGIRVIESNIPVNNSVTRVNSSVEAMRMLVADRVELVVNSHMGGLKTISEMNLSGIRVSRPPLQTSVVFHYLHADNKHLVQPLTDVLREMEKEGLMQAAWDQVFDALLASD